MLPSILTVINKPKINVRS